VAKNALGKGGARWLPVRKPELYAGEVFQTFARAQGVVLKAPVVLPALSADTIDIVAKNSAPLRDILTRMLKYSTNITAEAIGLAATHKRLGRGTDIVESAAEMNAWAKDNLGLETVAMVDHSGLGHTSRMTSGDMITALIAARRTVGLKPLLKELPMRDSSRKVIADHPVKVRAKTGTLNFVSGLAGFIDAPDGTEMAFAIFSAEMDRRASLTKAQRERPDGARGWNRRAKILQQDLIDRWSVLYGT
jgi:D-alanyl-D-alanine carboxypeptidase/D-alanyl-D-alanine-endopeptidase (penicillin-binding protein 4)